jgi:protein-disulfide isomerase
MTRDRIATALNVVAYAVVLAFVVGWAYSRLAHGTQATSENAAFEDEDRFWGRVDGGTWIGPTDAEVVVLVYSNYACTYCRNFGATMDEVRRRYPQHVALVVKHFVPPGNRSLRLEQMSSAAECSAELGRFEDFHREALREPDLFHSGSWRNPGRRAGLSSAEMASLEDCVRSRRHLGRVRAQFDEALVEGVDGTPVVVMRSRVFDGEPTLEQLEAAIISELRVRAQ